jgi:hypothetical protein
MDVRIGHGEHGLGLQLVIAIAGQILNAPVLARVDVQKGGHRMIAPGAASSHSDHAAIGPGVQHAGIAPSRGVEQECAIDQVDVRHSIGDVQKRAAVRLEVAIDDMQSCAENT